MNAHDILDMIGEAEAAFVWDAQQVREGSFSHSKRKLLIALLAAATALLLISCGVAATIYADNIEAWFSYRWEQITGQEMSPEQAAVIEGLSQDIGVSTTDGDLTITVDSATGSENIFYILVRVSGHTFTQNHRYNFETRWLSVDKNALPADLRVSSFGIRYLGVDENGAGLFLIDYDYGTSSEDLGSLDALPMTLLLENMTRRRPHSDPGSETVIEEGQWTVSFTLDRSQLPEKLKLPDREVGGMNNETTERVSVKLTDILLSSTGIRYTFDSLHGTVEPFGGITVVLKNGARIEDGQGTGTVEDDLTTRNYVWNWSIPLNIEDITSVIIGGTEIQVNTD